MRFYLIPISGWQKSFNKNTSKYLSPQKTKSKLNLLLTWENKILYQIPIPSIPHNFEKQSSIKRLARNFTFL
jgi:hypothetical protein